MAPFVTRISVSGSAFRPVARASPCASALTECGEAARGGRLHGALEHARDCGDDVGRKGRRGGAAQRDGLDSRRK